MIALTMTTEEMKRQVEAMSYEELLRKWRFAPAGDPMFAGEAGQYYLETMNRKRQALEPGQHVAASKAIGWDSH